MVISSDGQFALSGSWDATLRLWDLNTGNTTRRFIGHAKDVLSVAFSVDNRQVGRKRSSVVINLVHLTSYAPCAVCVVECLGHVVSQQSACQKAAYDAAAGLRNMLPQRLLLRPSGLDDTLFTGIDSSFL